MAGDREKAVALGYDDTKPVEMSRLLDVITVHVDLVTYCAKSAREPSATVD